MEGEKGWGGKEGSREGEREGGREGGREEGREVDIEGMGKEEKSGGKEGKGGGRLRCRRCRRASSHGSARFSDDDASL